MKNYYEILGVSNTATQEEIRKAYRELAKKYHPDKHPGEDPTIYEIKFNEITEAYDTLRNIEQRKKYDEELDAFKKRNSQRSNEQKTRRQSTCNNKSQQNEQSSKGSSNSDNNSNKKTDTESSKTSTNQTKSEKQKEHESFVDKVKKSYNEIREEEKSQSFTERHSKVNQSYSKYFDKFFRSKNIFRGVAFRTGQGVIHVSAELLYQLGKLKTINDDSVVKYTIRNRVLAGSIAGVILLTSVMPSFGKKDDSPVFQPTGTTTVTTPVDNDGPTGTSSVDDEGLAGVTNPVDKEDDNMITLRRKYIVEYGDSLSYLSDMSLTTIKEIQRANNMKSDALYVGDTLIIPYYVSSDDLQYYIQTVETEDLSLKDLADIYETDVETLCALNEDCISEVAGTKIINSDTIVVPNFITSDELKETKEAKARIKN